MPPRAFEVKHAVGSKTLPYDELKGEVLQTPDATAQSYPSVVQLHIPAADERAGFTVLTVCCLKLQVSPPNTMLV